MSALLRYELGRKRRQIKIPTIRLRLTLVLPALVLVVFVLSALFAETIAPHDYKGVNLAHSVLPPSWLSAGKSQYLLGTDQLGRDILSRIIYGARVSLIVACLAILFSGTVGTMLGMIAGYFGGRADALISRVVDVMMPMPTILLAMALLLVLGPSLLNIVIVIALVQWARYTRQARAEAFKIREMDYVALARIAGCSSLTIMLRHILPNVLNSVIVLATLQISYVILLESSLSFLGVGVPPPTPTWGAMVASGRDRLVSAWWISLFPGVAITLVVLAGNLFGDWLRDKLDPKLRDL